VFHARSVRLYIPGLRQEETLRSRIRAQIGLSELVKRVSEKFQVDPEKVKRPSKARRLAEARGVVYYLAVHQLGYSGAEVGKELQLGSTGVSIAARRGEKLFAKNWEIESWT
jgi:putative transposase